MPHCSKGSDLTAYQSHQTKSLKCLGIHCLLFEVSRGFPQAQSLGCPPRPSRCDGPPDVVCFQQSLCFTKTHLSMSSFHISGMFYMLALSAVTAASTCSESNKAKRTFSSTAFSKTVLNPVKMGRYRVGLVRYISV